MIVQVNWEHTDLFDMQEVFSFKKDPVPWYGDVVIICRSVGEVCAHGESNRLKLNNRNKKETVKEWKLYILITQHTECDTFASESFVSTWTAKVCVSVM